jgi:radical SAM enzyme (TIGR01210 family)
VNGAVLSPAAIRQLRPPKRPVDPWRPLAHFWESERRAVGDSGEIPALTVLLAGAECPFTCVFCDLWRETLDGPTPPGALPAQLRVALDEAGTLPRPAAVKLYNASNFFDPRALPESDEEAILELVAPFARTTVECHPRLVGRRCLRFAERLAERGGRLEVAMGLETIHPEALPRLGKEMTLDDFDRAAAALAAADVGVRAFVLVGAPFVPAEEAVEWAVRSAAHAFALGAARVSLIPVRPGNGALEKLWVRGDFEAPRLDDLEEAFEQCLAMGKGIATADVWDVRRFASCDACAERRIARLVEMNRTGRVASREACAACGWS